MEIHVTTQGMVFLWMLACGVCFGLLFDLFRALRKMIPMNGFWVNVSDLVFWFFCTALVFFTARKTNQGELRWYEFSGLFLGMGLYFAVFGSLVVQWITRVLFVLVKGVVLIVRVVVFPLQLIARPFLWVNKKTAPLRKKIAFGWSVRRQKWLFSCHQLKKILKSPKFF